MWEVLVNDIQFDFVYFTENETANYKGEIENRGGYCYLVAAPNHDPIGFEKDIHKLYKAHYGQWYAVHLHDTFLPAFLLDCKRKIGAKKLIAHAHLTSYGEIKTKAIRNYILSLPKYMIIDEFWACSHEAGYALAGKAIFERKGMILNNAIKLNKFVFTPEERIQYRKSLGIDDSFVIGHVGHFSNQKNHKFLVEVFKKVLEKKPNSRLVLVGEGSNRAMVEKQCEEAGISSKVLFLGVRKDVNLLLNAFDVFLFPSLYEGLPVSLIEAQAVGLPCVYSDTITREVNILKLQNKVMSLDDSYSSWAEEVVSSRKEYVDPQQELRKAGLDIEVEANKIVDCYIGNK